MVVSVPAKSGTTWTMNIVHQLREVFILFYLFYFILLLLVVLVVLVLV